MRGKAYKRAVAVAICILFLLAGTGSAEYGVSGKVITLPMNFEGSEGPAPTPVSGMPVVFNESKNERSTEEGVYAFALDASMKGSLYILRLDDDISIGDMSVHEDIYLPTYTIPTVFEELNKDKHDAMVFTADQLTQLGIPPLTSGKGAIMVLMFDADSGEFLTGATAVIRNMNGGNVGTVRYIAFDSTQPLGVKLATSPDSSSAEDGGTVGFIAYNIDPGTVMVSASRSNYSFMWRPAFIYADSITSGVSEYDGILGRAGSYEIEETTGYLVDEKGVPVSGATITLCGMNISARTNSYGSFTVRNVPSPAIAIVKASKSGYKDTYSYAFIKEGDDEEATFKSLNSDGEPKFMIISETFANKLGMDFGGGGVIAGSIGDEDGNPIKNAQVYGWKVYDGAPTNTSYVDCMMEGIDENLDVTSDSGIFVLDSMSIAPLGLSTKMPIYLQFEHLDTEDNVFYTSPHYIAPVFNNGIMLLLNEICEDRSIGRVYVSDGIPSVRIVDPGLYDVELFYMKLELPQIDEEPVTSLQSPVTSLKSFTLTYEGFLPESIGLYQKREDIWWGVIGDQITINEELHTITFTCTPGQYLLTAEGIELLVKGNIPSGASGKFYCELVKNCDMVVTADLEEELLNTTSVYVSVSGAPAKGNEVYVKTAEPSIATDPKEMDFGEVKVGENKTLRITIYNTSEVAVQVTSSIEGTNASDFSEGLAPGSIMEIPTGEIRCLDIVFSPQSSGIRSASLRLSYTGYAAEGEDVIVPLTGTGIGGGDSGGGDGGCFIATAAFGSPLHPCVGLLRNFRDSVLLTHTAGRAFVRWYYIHSPAAARVIEGSIILKTMTRILLLPVIGIVYLILNGILPYL
ncbi:MAG: choice-of-anchor D domain-containing protein, partial [Candidatus Ratteibacteria bacterium]|nr:choice-of-anchor D domain-containing protein [Candidatus Ratteibacteria bacterium]